MNGQDCEPGWLIDGASATVGSNVRFVPTPNTRWIRASARGAALA